MTNTSTTATHDARTGSVLEEALPIYDVVLTGHRVVGAEVDTLFATARDFDFLPVRSPLVTAMMTARALPNRLRGKPLDAPTHLRLASEPGGVAGLAPAGAGSGA